jgi:glucose-6-phosphate isomerase
VIKKLLVTKNFIPKKFLDKRLIKRLSKKFQKTIIDVFNDVSEEKKVLNILSDQFKLNFKNEDLKKFKRFKTIAIIGMGGSILAAEAINNFLENKIKKKVYFFNDLDSEKILKFKKNNDLKKVLFLIISKSGNTIETLSNLFFLEIVKKKTKNIILIAEKNNNSLVELSKKFNLFYIEHKNYIGGRYSVFSEVGIIPALLMGLNVTKLKSNIMTFLKNKEKLFLKDSSVKLACLLDTKKINSLVFLNYSPELNKFLYWCQQLIAESLGKKGKGFLPMISNVPKDHHSLLQLYLDGPKNKLFHIFSIEKKMKQKINVKKYTDKINFLHNKTIEKVKNAQRKALIKTFNKNQIPYREFKIKQINEVVLGELFSYFILETIIIGKLININPFDQPAVEQVKTFTKKMLS